MDEIETPAGWCDYCREDHEYTMLPCKRDEWAWGMRPPGALPPAVTAASE